jgi:hypothetical protein
MYRNVLLRKGGTQFAVKLRMRCSEFGDFRTVVLARIKKVSCHVSLRIIPL